MDAGAARAEEPYVVAADVYAVSQHSGRGGWTWYTGSAGWLYQLIVDSLFGLQRRADTLHFDPCLPEEWGDVTIRYKFKSTTYVIEMVHKLNQYVCVEGVETKEDLEKIKALGPDLIQGYYYSKPCSRDEFLKKFFGYSE